MQQFPWLRFTVFASGRAYLLHHSGALDSHRSFAFHSTHPIPIIQFTTCIGGYWWISLTGRATSVTKHALELGVPFWLARMTIILVGWNTNFPYKFKSLHPHTPTTPTHECLNHGPWGELYNRLMYPTSWTKPIRLSKWVIFSPRHTRSVEYCLWLLKSWR